MNLLTEDEVLVVRARLAATSVAQRAFGSVDALYPDRLSSSIARQQTGFGGYMKYNSVVEVAATLFYGLNMNHAFENGNKRTALVTMLVFLDRNGVWLIDTSEDDLYDLATGIASHDAVDERGDAEVFYIAEWLGARTRHAERKERRMRFREFRRVLEAQGCEFDPPKDNAIKIRRRTAEGEFTVKAGYPNQHHEVPLGEIRRIRRALKLDDSHGYDSAAFYDLEGTVDEFVNTYRQLMNRLADM